MRGRVFNSLEMQDAIIYVFGIPRQKREKRKKRELGSGESITVHHSPCSVKVVIVCASVPPLVVVLG